MKIKAIPSLTHLLTSIMIINYLTILFDYGVFNCVAWLHVNKWLHFYFAQLRSDVVPKTVGMLSDYHYYLLRLLAL